jgi:2Fe-2S ferredoxin
MQVTVVDRAGARYDIFDEKAVSVMEVIRNEGLSIAAQCGGCACCGTCHVYVDAIWLDRLPPAGPEESAMLEFVEEYRAGSRLSCQLKSSDGLSGITVTLAPGTEF